MRRLALVLWLVAAPVSAQTWVEGDRIGVSLSGHSGPTAIFIGGGHAGWNDAHAAPSPMAPGVWHTVSVPSSVPSDVASVFLSGLLIITNTSPGLCNLTATFRAPGSTLDAGNYQMQTLAIPGDGSRSNAALWVPVVRGQYQFYWTMTPGCASLINLTLQAYVRRASDVPAPVPAGRWFRICDGVPVVCYEGLLPPGGG